MDPLTFEAVTRNPEIIRALMKQAQRERAEAVHRLIVEPIKSLFRRSRSSVRRAAGNRFAAP